MYAGACEIAKQFSDKYDVHPLKVMVVAELELIRFRDKQPIIPFRQYSPFLQLVRAPPYGFDQKV